MRPTQGDYDDLVDTIEVVAFSDEGTWQERRDKVVATAKARHCYAELIEFISWWNDERPHGTTRG